jgi:DMSO/TMAO reductase YedYZ molybdopterin-dependent catalytic subunit
MDKQQKPTLWTGALVGLLLSAPLLAIFYLAFELVGTPFVPFDVFDWVARILPGPLIEFVISTMVNIINTFQLGETSSAAKTAEHIQAVGGLFITGIIAGAVLFAVLRRIEVKSRYLPGLITGLVVGAPVMFISTSINKSASASMLVSAIWIMVAFIVWGLAFSWVYNRLTAIQSPSTAAATVQQIDRRRFLLTVGGAAAAVTVVGSGLALLLQQSQPSPEEVALSEADGSSTTGPWSATHALPNADDPVKAVAGTRPELTPLKDHYRIDINALPPVVKEDEWTLQFSGLVESETAMTLNDIRTKYAPVDQFVTLACISNPLGGSLTSTQRWTGASLQKVLADVKLKPEATHLKITAADGFDEYVDLETINKDDRIMLSYEWDGLPLEAKHGFPIRIYIPDHYGMKQPKWITNIEAVDQWQEGYWVRRGWDKDAFMRATSVIDTVATDMMITEADNTMKIPVGGIAHAGSRGISKVEVKVDDGDWTEAQLRSPLSQTTWVIWHYEWPFEAGDHTFSVRCFDGNGTEQIETPAGVAPSGATGIDSQNVML